jgi:3-isopropylmalate/(R)-2-methylmalate dehydratase small subunit
VSAVAAPVPVAHIDTDQILPARYMKTLTREGLGQHLFREWRYGPQGEQPDFVLNQPDRRRAGIIVAYENFGCGSSREHAVWALCDFGVRAVIAPSFGAIFATNCVKNGLLPVCLDRETCDVLIEEANAQAGAEIVVDLEQQIVVSPTGVLHSFRVPPHVRNVLLEGVDDIDRTLAHSAALASYEQARRSRRSAP